MHKRKIITQLIHSINPNIKVKFRRNSNNCNIVKQTIYLDLKATRSLDSLHHYNRVLKLHGFRKTIDTTLWVVLHEVGHIMTAHKVKDLRGAIQAQADKVHAWVEHECDIPQKHLTKGYALLELENNANSWVFHYVKHNRKAMTLINEVLK